MKPETFVANWILVATILGTTSGCNTSFKSLGMNELEDSYTSGEINITYFPNNSGNCIFDKTFSDSELPEFIKRCKPIVSRARYIKNGTLKLRCKLPSAGENYDNFQTKLEAITMGILYGIMPAYERFKSDCKMLRRQPRRFAHRLRRLSSCSTGPANLHLILEFEFPKESKVRYPHHNIDLYMLEPYMKDFYMIEVLYKASDYRSSGCLDVLAPTKWADRITLIFFCTNQHYSTLQLKEFLEKRHQLLFLLEKIHFMFCFTEEKGTTGIIIEYHIPHFFRYLLKFLHLHFLLGINEDFDDDLLQDAIELLHG